MLQYIADAFTDTLFTGNPAGVLPCREMLDPALMQAIAIENNYSETAFVVKRGPG
jgi:PhzF family phenazine biosynthesis protein